MGPPCSRNPHDKAVVVRRAQLRTHEPAPLGEVASELGRKGEGGLLISGARATRTSPVSFVAREAYLVPEFGRFTSDVSRVRTQAPSGANSTDCHEVEKGAADLLASISHPTMM